MGPMNEAYSHQFSGAIM